MEVARGCVIELHGVNGTFMVFLNYLVQVKSNFHVYKDSRGLQRQADQGFPVLHLFRDILYRGICPTIPSINLEIAQVSTV